MEEKPTSILIHQLDSDFLVLALDVLDASRIPVWAVAVLFIRFPNLRREGFECKTKMNECRGSAKESQLVVITRE